MADRGTSSSGHPTSSDSIGSLGTGMGGSCSIDLCSYSLVILQMLLRSLSLSRAPAPTIPGVPQPLSMVTPAPGSIPSGTRSARAPHRSRACSLHLHQRLPTALAHAEPRLERSGTSHHEELSPVKRSPIASVHSTRHDSHRPVRELHRSTICCTMPCVYTPHRAPLQPSITSRPHTHF